jgi:hypothetical protein
MEIDTGEFQAITEQVAELTEQALTAREAFRLGVAAGERMTLGLDRHEPPRPPRHLRAIQGGGQR